MIPDVRALGQSIRTHGVREPLVVSQDYYLFSGHRRLVAAAQLREEILLQRSWHENTTSAGVLWRSLVM